MDHTSQVGKVLERSKRVLVVLRRGQSLEFGTQLLEAVRVREKVEHGDSHGSRGGLSSSKQDDEAFIQQAVHSSLVTRDMRVSQGSHKHRRLAVGCLAREEFVRALVLDLVAQSQ